MLPSGLKSIALILVPRNATRTEFRKLRSGQSTAAAPASRKAIFSNRESEIVASTRIRRDRSPRSSRTKQRTTGSEAASLSGRVAAMNRGVL
jgi:hypothetical protein